MITESVLKRLKSVFESHYETIEDFVRTTKCPTSRETVRRLLYEGKAVSTHVFIIIAKYLGFSAQDIAEMLRECGDREFYPLLSEFYVSEWDKKLIELFAIIRKKKKLDAVLDYIEFAARDKEVTKIIQRLKEG